MSKIEYCNCCLGYIEEVALDKVQYNESLYGFSRQVSFRVVNSWRCEPLIECGSQTAGASSTILTDTAADFFRRNVVPGDIILNSTDCGALWDVTGVTSKTVLCVRLNTSGGGSDDFATSDVYVIRRKNAERIFIPNLTKIRMTNRITCIEVFNGIVMEIDPEGGQQARHLCVLASGFDIQLRDATPTTSNSTPAIRSTVIGNIFDDKTCEFQLVFPLVAGDERSPGIEPSPNGNTVNCDFAKSQRNALAALLDLGGAEFWTRTGLINQRSPATIANTADNCQTELVLRAEGSLATRFETDCQFCVGKITLELNRNACFVGNIYLRIEPEEPTISGIDPTPSGYLVTPNAESNLINAGSITLVACGSSCQDFTFDGPIPLAPCTGYWLVLSYQEKNNNFVACTTGINWRIDTCDAVACPPTSDRSTAIFASNVWCATTTSSFNFTIHRFSEGVWFYDFSAGTFIDRTAAIEACDCSSMPLMADAASSCDESDRLYVGVAGPIRGLQFCYCTASSAEYGTWTAKYHGGHRAKLYGTVTTACASGTCLTLTDSTKNFSKIGICVGDILYNITDNSVGIITAVAPGKVRTTMTIKDLFTNELSPQCGVSKTFVIGDEYAVLGWEKIICGCGDATSATTLTDATKCFPVLGVRVGDLVVNETDNLVSFITSYTATTVVVGCGAMSWVACDSYAIYSRWRTLELRDLNNTFITPPATVLPVIMEWTIPADWEPLRFTSNIAVDLGPEAQDPGTCAGGCVACSCHQRYFLVLQNSSIPATEASVDLMSALPGAGFGVRVSNHTRSTVICNFACAASNSCCATKMVDNSRNFFGDANTVGIYVCDIIDNSTDGSSGTITAIDTINTACSSANCRITATLSGGSDNSFDTCDKYVLRRNQYPLEYFRLGSRPLGGATRYGMTFICGGKGSCQMISMYSSDVSKSSRTATNRVSVTGQTICCGCAATIVTNVTENRRGQREFKRTVQKSIVDLSVDTLCEATDRGEAEISKFVDAQERVQAIVYGWPTITKLVDRKAWRLQGVCSEAVMDGRQNNDFDATGGSASTLIDTDINFFKWGVKKGDIVTRETDCAQMIVTAISTTTNKNDTLCGTCFSGTWVSGNDYKIERRDMLQVGCLVRVRISDGVPTARKNIDECYLVTHICYTEPSQEFNVRLQRNFSSSATGDFRDPGELSSFVTDQVKRLGQLARLASGIGI